VPASNCYAAPGFVAVEKLPQNTVLVRKFSSNNATLGAETSPSFRGKFMDKIDIFGVKVVILVALDKRIRRSVASPEERSVAAERI